MSPASRVGYVVSRFPKTTETFILREMEAVERQGWAVVPFAINREPDEIRQPGAERYLEQLSAVSDLTPAAAALAQLRLLVRRPGRWFGVWWRAVTGNLRSPKFLVRALVIAWGTPDGPAGIAVCYPHDGKTMSAGNGNMIALQAKDKAQVDKIYNLAISLGATDEGPPGPRGDTFYAGYFRDPDGNKLNAFVMG